MSGENTTGGAPATIPLSPASTPAPSPSVPSLSVQSPIAPSLRAQLEAAARAVPAGQQGAATVAASFFGPNAGVEGRLAHKVKPNWTVSAWGAYRWTGGAEAGMQSQWTW